MKRLLPVLAICFCFTACGDGDSSTPSTPTSTPPPPQPTVENFTISSEDGEIAYSAPLATLSSGQSFEVQFKPMEIHQGPSGFSNVVEFWLDKDEGENPIAMGFEWFPDSKWGVYSFTLQDGFIDFNVFRLIHVGGRFRTVRIRRANGFSEWLLDDESLVVLPDTKTRRTVFTRVVGTAAAFRYEGTPTNTSRASSTRAGGPAEGPCANCKQHR